MNLKSLNKLDILVNSLVSLSFIVLLLGKGTYNSPALLILVGFFYSIYFFIKKQQWSIHKEEKWLIIAYLIYFANFLASVFYHGGKISELDDPSRVLFFLPLLLLFKNHNIIFRIVMLSIPTGAIIAGSSALFQKFILHKYAAFEYMLQIQGGDISMSLGLFSLVVALYFTYKKQFVLASFSILGTTLGMLGSFLSTARGGWICLPVLIPLIFLFYRKQLNKKFILSLILIFGALITVSILSPQTNMLQRFKVAQQNIQVYEKGKSNTSIGIRLELWKSALFMAQEKPIFGWGKSHIAEKRKQQISEGKISKYVLFGHAHNQFLDDLSKRGIIGLLALLGVFFTPLYIFIKNLNVNNLTIRVTAILGIIHVLSTMSYCLTQSFFAHNSGNMFYFFFTVVFISMISTYKNKQKVIN